MTNQGPTDKLKVLYEDRHLIVVAKPAPLLTQAPSGIPSLESQVKEYIRRKDAKPAGVYLGVPHRLDRPVTGVVVFARNTKAARSLAEQFRDRQATRTYWAIVSGQVYPDEGTWEDWLLKIPDQARSEVVSEETPSAKRAVLEYRVLHREPKATFLEFSLLTGRSHQIRVQAASRGHPVWGDVIYGSDVSFGPPAELPRDRVIALHGKFLAFEHPAKKKEVLVFLNPPPSYWPSWWRKVKGTELLGGSIGDDTP